MNNSNASMKQAPLVCSEPEEILPSDSQFFTKFNQSDFMFSHGLAGHPLFEVSSLIGLAERIPRFRDFVYWQNGRVDVDAHWSSNPSKRLTVEETIEGIAENNSLVILKHAEQDPVYGPVLQTLLQRMFIQTNPEVQADIQIGESLIFINSPNRKTPYHVDLESSFLLQVVGEKQLHAFSSTDRSITPHIELENHCRGEHGVVYKPETQAGAHSYRLLPGYGVHFPSFAPHWVQNGSTMSISVNINFEHRSVHQRTRRIYRMNSLIRRLGLEPMPPGVSPLRDSLKVAVSHGAGGFIQLARDALRKRDPNEAYPIWRPVR
jgi:hypothetical protein